MIKGSVMALLLGLAACAPHNATPADRRTNSDTTTARPAISLERRPCFGSCPVYTISASPSGQITFEGRAHVLQVGRAAGQIPSQRVDSLLIELERAGYFGFFRRYVLSELTCGTYVTDQPTVISTATLDGRTQRIEHDYGCGAAPAALAVLEKRIDEVLGSDRWTGREK